MNGITQVVPATAGQIKQINRLIADAVEKIVTELGLDKDGAQRVIEHGDELVGNIGEVAMATLKDLSVTDKYKDEEVKSNHGYLSGYKKPKGITEQTNILRQLFPGIGFADEKLAEREVPKNADDGWFAIPKWQSLAPTYGEAVQLVLNKLKETRNGAFCNYLKGELGPDQLRQSAKTASVFQKLAEEQNGFDILVVAAQFGLRHRGHSVRRVREILLGNEFGLGAFAIGIMLLTHPNGSTTTTISGSTVLVTSSLRLPLAASRGLLSSSSMATSWSSAPALCPMPTVAVALCRRSFRRIDV